MKRNRTTLACALAVSAVLFSFTCLQAAPPPDNAVGAVYTMSNAPEGNMIVALDRFPDGSLMPSGTYETEGLGTGTGLGNQGGVVLSDDHRWLLAVNAGSDEVSVFSVSNHGLVLTDTAPSGGVMPVSVAIRGNLVYVLNAGGSAGAEDNIQGFHLTQDGELTFMDGTSRPLSAAATGPAQIGFSPEGRFLVVTEKGTNVVDTYRVDRHGRAHGPVVNAAAGTTPFAFGFGKRDLLIVSEVSGGAEDAGTVSSYRLLDDGTLEVVAAAVPNNETAPCWLVVDNGGRHVYTTNTPDDSLSLYDVTFDGGLVLRDPDGRSGEPGEGTRPLDMDLTANGRYLYTLNIGDDTVGAFRLTAHGGLEYLHATPGVPDGANGLAVR